MLVDKLANAKACINWFAGRPLYALDGWVSFQAYSRQKTPINIREFGTYESTVWIDPDIAGETKRNLVL